MKNSFYHFFTLPNFHHSLLLKNKFFSHTFSINSLISSSPSISHWYMHHSNHINTLRSHFASNYFLLSSDSLFSLSFSSSLFSNAHTLPMKNPLTPFFLISRLSHIPSLLNFHEVISAQKLFPSILLHGSSWVTQPLFPESSIFFRIFS